MDEVKYSQEWWQGRHSGETNLEDANKRVKELESAMRDSFDLLNNIYLHSWDHGPTAGHILETFKQILDQ